MAANWNNNAYNMAIRLGHLAIQAQGLVLARRIQSIQNMAKAHTRDLLKLPGGKRRLEEAQQHFDAVKRIIKDEVDRG